MRINYNASAMRANNALNVTENRVSTSLQRLSSGLKINRAKDNPSGYAIGRRMDVQIAGVAVATKNANTGISVIQTADGALTEVHDMLQRMNELAVKGSTGTLTTADREILNQEVIQLKKEIARVAQDTEFNGQPLLDGSFDLKGYTNNLKVKAGYYSDAVIPRKYEINELTVVYDKNGNIDKDATVIKLASSGDNAFPQGVKISETTKNTITLKGPLDFEMTLEVEPDPVIDENGNITGYNPVWIAGDYSISAEAVWDGPNELNIPATMQSFNQAFQQAAEKGVLGETYGIQWPNGTHVDSIVKNDQDFYVINFASSEGVFMHQYIRNNGATPGLTTSYYNWEVSEPLIIDVTGIGAMDTQIGANEGQILKIRIPTISLQRMGIADVEVTTAEKSDDANVAIKSAIQYVSDARSRLGAYQNRLEHTISNLDITSENMTASYSRIMDVDMAEEMTYYTTQQVVEQAAISMLAQANERPSQVLQLLQ